MNGVLIAGRIVSIPGVNVIMPAAVGGPSWAYLKSSDCRTRSRRCAQLVFHTTKGDWPQHVLAGRGPGGRGESTAKFWQDDPKSSAAHIVIDNNGDLVCLTDLATICAYHATVSNEYSIGIELYQESDGGVYEAVYETAVRAAPILCDALDIPFTVVADVYTGHPLPRFLDGGPDFYGILGHRHNTEQRDRGDPGDEIFARLIDAGGEPVFAGQREDIGLALERQRWLVDRGEALTVDGLAGPKSLAAARRHGFNRWGSVPRLA